MEDDNESAVSTRRSMRGETVAIDSNGRRRSSRLAKIEKAKKKEEKRDNDEEEEEITKKIGKRRRVDGEYEEEPCSSSKIWKEMRQMSGDGEGDGKDMKEKEGEDTDDDEKVEEEEEEEEIGADEADIEERIVSTKVEIERVKDRTQEIYKQKMLTRKELQDIQATKEDIEMKERLREEYGYESDSDDSDIIRTSDFTYRPTGYVSMFEQDINAQYKKDIKEQEAEEESDGVLEALKEVMKGDRKAMRIIREIEKKERMADVYKKRRRNQAELERVMSILDMELNNLLWEMDGFSYAMQELMNAHEAQAKRYDELSAELQRKGVEQDKQLKVMKNRVAQWEDRLQEVEIEGAVAGRTALPLRQTNRQYKRYLGKVRDLLERLLPVCPHPYLERMLEISQEDFDVIGERTRILRILRREQERFLVNSGLLTRQRPAQYRNMMDSYARNNRMR